MCDLGGGEERARQGAPTAALTLMPTHQQTTMQAMLAGCTHFWGRTCKFMSFPAQLGVAGDTKKSAKKTP